MNITTRCHIIKEGIKGDLFHRAERVDFTVILRDCFRFEIDSMIPFVKWGKFM